MDIIVYGGLLVIIVLLVVLIVQISALKKANASKDDGLAPALAELEVRLGRELAETEQRIDRELEKLKNDLVNEIRGSRAETMQYIQTSVKGMADMLTSNQKESAEAQDMRLAELSRNFGDMSLRIEQKLENIRNTMETRIGALTEDNNKQLELMRNTVDEKLQKTLDDRITQSFKLVSERLEQVYKGLGEMQTLATGVGDLKRVLSNVKTRGIFGEIQLGAILEQVLSPEQYEENIATKAGSSERVEYAIKLPGEGDKPVYLPIDAKFPADIYGRLSDAYESGDGKEIEEASKQLIARIKSEAKDIKEKYVYPPDTTDFAIMFLPVEGLYAEVIRTRGMVEALQKDYKVVVAGPTTMAAILNSMQMGFRTLAIQKHSSEVWDVLGAVKTEFEKFGGVLQKTQERLRQADSELDKLIGTRTNVINQKLRKVQSLSAAESERLLGTDIPDLEIE